MDNIKELCRAGVGLYYTRSASWRRTNKNGGDRGINWTPTGASTCNEEDIHIHYGFVFTFDIIQ